MTAINLAGFPTKKELMLSAIIFVGKFFNSEPIVFLENLKVFFYRHGIYDYDIASRIVRLYGEANPLDITRVIFNFIVNEEFHEDTCQCCGQRIKDSAFGRLKLTQDEYDFILKAGKKGVRRIFLDVKDLAIVQSLVNKKYAFLLREFVKIRKPILSIVFEEV